MKTAGKKKSLRYILVKLSVDTSIMLGSGMVKQGGLTEDDKEWLNNKFDQAIKEIQELYEPMSEIEINKIADKCMYDFPKGYTNAQIAAFQKRYR